MNVHTLAIDPTGPTTLYAGTYGSGVFKCAPPLTISGYVRGFPNFSGVMMSGLPETPSTSGSGYYAGTVYQNWSGVVIPQKSGYYFSPASRSYGPVTQNMSFQNYSAFAVATPTPTRTPTPTVTPTPTIMPTPGSSYLLWTR